jgi:hypothetical protein
MYFGSVNVATEEENNLFQQNNLLEKAINKTTLIHPIKQKKHNAAALQPVQALLSLYVLHAIEDVALQRTELRNKLTNNKEKKKKNQTKTKTKQESIQQRLSFFVTSRETASSAHLAVEDELAPPSSFLKNNH